MLKLFLKYLIFALILGILVIMFNAVIKGNGIVFNIPLFFMIQPMLVQSPEFEMFLMTYFYNLQQITQGSC